MKFCLEKITNKNLIVFEGGRTIKSEILQQEVIKIDTSTFMIIQNVANLR